MPLICHDCSKEVEEVIYSSAEDKPFPRCNTCHFSFLMKLEKIKTPEEEKEIKKKRNEALAKAREAAKAKRQAKKEVQEGKRETA